MGLKPRTERAGGDRVVGKDGGAQHDGRARSRVGVVRGVAINYSPGREAAFQLGVTFVTVEPGLLEENNVGNFRKLLYFIKDPGPSGLGVGVFSVGREGGDVVGGDGVDG